MQLNGQTVLKLGSLLDKAFGITFTLVYTDTMEIKLVGEDGMY